MNAVIEKIEKHMAFKRIKAYVMELRNAKDENKEKGKDKEVEKA